MIRLVKRFIGWLKIIFKKGGSMGYEFPEFKVEEILKDCKVEENATTDGKRNLPPPTAEVFSKTENCVIQKSDQFRQKHVKECASSLTNNKDKIINYEANLGTEYFSMAEVTKDVKKTEAAAVGKLSRDWDDYVAEDREVSNFAKENNLTREPKHISIVGMIIALIVVAVLFFIELEVNSEILKTAIGGGKKMGITVAGSVAALNVFVSFAAGIFLLKNFHHVKPFRRIAGQLGTLFYSLFIIYINWMMGAYRAIYEIHGIKMLATLGEKKSEAQVAMEAMCGKGLVLTNQAAVMANEGVEAICASAVTPWLIGLTPKSAILIFVGIGFALISLIDGYFFDDPYPGYGRIGKHRNENKTEINRIREHLATEMGSHFNKATTSANNKRDQLIKVDLLNWTKQVNDLEHTFADYVRFAKQIDDGVDNQCGKYRGINSTYRSEAIPKYWCDESGKVKKRYYNLSVDNKNPEIVFPSFATLYLKKDEIEKKIENYRNKITTAFNQFNVDLNKYREEVNKIIEDIRKEYDVTKIS